MHTSMFGKVASTQRKCEETKAKAFRIRLMCGHRDLVDRNWRVDAPNQLVVADFTHVAMAGGWHADTAFVVDAYADKILPRISRTAATC